MSENLTFELEDNKNEMRIISDIILGTEGGSCVPSREPLLDRPFDRLHGMQQFIEVVSFPPFGVGVCERAAVKE